MRIVAATAPILVGLLVCTAASACEPVWVRPDAFRNYQVVALARVMNLDWDFWTGQATARLALVRNVRGTAPQRSKATFRFYPWACANQRFHTGQIVFAFYDDGPRNPMIMPTAVVPDEDLNKARMALK